MDDEGGVPSMEPLMIRRAQHQQCRCGHDGWLHKLRTGYGQCFAADAKKPYAKAYCTCTFFMAVA